MRRATWILWLMLALLPLRGWAVAGMAMPQGSGDQDVVVMTSMADHASTPTSAMPCHQGTPEFEAGSTCQACDWCHAVMVTAPEPSVPGKPPMADAPTVSPQRDTGRPAVGGLERPPRSFLA